MPNVDINPPDDFVRAHPRFAALLENKPLSKRFATYEEAAVRSKTWYTFFGVTSLATAFATLVLLIANLTLAPDLASNRTLSIALGCVGAAGVVAQLVLLASPLKNSWLRARYAAERLRGVKFQAFVAALSGDAAVDAFTADAIANLLVELDRPHGALREFNPELTLAGAVAPGSIDADRLGELKAIYRTLRLDYQINHAQHCIEAIKTERRLPVAASEISFWAGAALGFLDFILTAFWIDAGAEIRRFFALALFVTSAILFVSERGRGHDEALERYEDYHRELTRLAERLDEANTAEQFIARIVQCERAAMRELKLFARQVNRSTYLF